MVVSLESRGQWRVTVTMMISVHHIPTAPDTHLTIIIIYSALGENNFFNNHLLQLYLPGDDYRGCWDSHKIGKLSLKSSGVLSLGFSECMKHEILFWQLEIKRYCLIMKQRTVTMITSFDESDLCLRCIIVTKLWKCPILRVRTCDIMWR